MSSRGVRLASPNPMKTFSSSPVSIADILDPDMITPVPFVARNPSAAIKNLGTTGRTGGVPHLPEVNRGSELRRCVSAPGTTRGPASNARHREGIAASPLGDGGWSRSPASFQRSSAVQAHEFVFSEVIANEKFPETREGNGGAARRAVVQSLCLPLTRMHFCEVAAARVISFSGRGTVPLNWFNSGFREERVGSSAGRARSLRRRRWPDDGSTPEAARIPRTHLSIKPGLRPGPSASLAGPQCPRAPALPGKLRRARRSPCESGRPGRRPLRRLRTLHPGVVFHPCSKLVARRATPPGKTLTEPVDDLRALIGVSSSFVRPRKLLLESLSRSATALRGPPKIRPGTPRRLPAVDPHGLQLPALCRRPRFLARCRRPHVSRGRRRASNERAVFPVYVRWPVRLRRRETLFAQCACARPSDGGRSSEHPDAVRTRYPQTRGVSGMPTRTLASPPGHLVPPPTSPVVRMPCTFS